MSQNFLTNPPVEMVSKELEGALDNSYDDELDNTATLFIKFSDRTLKVTGNLSALTCVRGCVKELRLDNVKKRDALVAVVDNAFDTRHPALVNRVENTYDIADNDRDVLPPKL
jgi:subtilisin family serine protease